MPGYPWYTNGVIDIQVEAWKEKAKDSAYHRNAIYTWTELDVRKQDRARTNKLNYKTIY